MMNVYRDITFIYIWMIGYHPSSLTLTVVGHFLIEHLVNEIISNRCKNAKKIIEYSFSTKVEFLNSMNLLPNDLYINIKNLNSIRNNMVHTLEANLKSVDFYKSSGQKIIIKTPKSGDLERHYLKMLSQGTLIGLRNYMLSTLKISTDYSFLL